MLRILRATDFQGITVANLKLSAVTVLAGPNGSGFTTVAASHGAACAVECRKVGAK